MMICAALSPIAEVLATDYFDLLLGKIAVLKDKNKFYLQKLICLLPPFDY